jgi:hypothetical protein
VNEEAETCRRRAFECEHKALAATEAEARRLYWRIAALWRDIARLSSNREDERDRREAQTPRATPQ